MYANVDLICRELAPLHILPVNTPVEVDLRDLEGLSPSAAALLIASLRALRSYRACDPLERFSPPVEGPLAKVLSPAGLEQLLLPAAGRNWGAGLEASYSLNCQPFSNAHGITRAAWAIQAFLAARTAWTEADLASVGVMISEMAENVLQHSDSRGGVVTVQVHPQADLVEFAIADCGIGIRESLVTNPAHSDIDDDLTAIRRASMAGVTSEAGTGGGLGLFLARLVVMENGGSLLIRSGEAAFEQGEEAAVRSSLPFLQGALVVVRARRDRAFDYDRIDHWLEEPGGVAG